MVLPNSFPSMAGVTQRGAGTIFAESFKWIGMRVAYTQISSQWGIMDACKKSA
jgi:hypothetical protein